MKLKAQGKKVVDKLWGWEYWIENNDKYCGKLLYLLPGYQSSLHVHHIKDETFMALEGLVQLEIANVVYYADGVNDYWNWSVEYLRSWCHDAVRIKPNTAHRFQAVDRPAIVAEFSTSHSDEDVYRLQKSRKSNYIF